MLEVQKKLVQISKWRVKLPPVCLIATRAFAKALYRASSRILSRASIKASTTDSTKQSISQSFDRELRVNLYSKAPERDKNFKQRLSCRISSAFVFISQSFIPCFYLEETSIKRFVESLNMLWYIKLQHTFRRIELLLSNRHCPQ